MKDIIHPLRVLHGNIHDWCTTELPLYVERFHHPKAVYLVFTPEHGNLGDHAIAQAEKNLLEELDIPYIEVSTKKLREWDRDKCLHIMNGRPILISGGGNLGSLWPQLERLMEKVVASNPGSSIRILPNTYYYGESPEDIRLKENSKQIYNGHPDLVIYAREQSSYDAMLPVYNKVKIVPDMALRLNECREKTSRDGAVICFRSDHERTRSDELEDAVKEKLISLFENKVTELDMMRPYPIPIAEREGELEKQLNAFRHAELVVTDRLHGMIFCAITGTPCIVIDSKSPKLRGCYEWIKELPYIRFCEDPTQIAAIYEEISKQEWNYDNSRLLPLYEPLVTDLLAITKR